MRPRAGPSRALEPDTLQDGRSLRPSRHLSAVLGRPAYRTAFCARRGSLPWRRSAFWIRAPRSLRRNSKPRLSVTALATRSEPQTGGAQRAAGDIVGRRPFAIALALPHRFRPSCRASPGSWPSSGSVPGAMRRRSRLAAWCRAAVSVLDPFAAACRKAHDSPEPARSHERPVQARVSEPPGLFEPQNSYSSLTRTVLRGAPWFRGKSNAASYFSACRPRPILPRIAGPAECDCSAGGAQ